MVVIGTWWTSSVVAKDFLPQTSDPHLASGFWFGNRGGSWVPPSLIWDIFARISGLFSWMRITWPGLAILGSIFLILLWMPFSSFSLFASQSRNCLNLVADGTPLPSPQQKILTHGSNSPSSNS